MLPKIWDISILRRTFMSILCCQRTFRIRKIFKHKFLNMGLPPPFLNNVKTTALLVWDGFPYGLFNCWTPKQSLLAVTLASPQFDETQLIQLLFHPLQPPAKHTTVSKRKLIHILRKQRWPDIANQLNLNHQYPQLSNANIKMDPKPISGKQLLKPLSSLVVRLVFHLTLLDLPWLGKYNLAAHFIREYTARLNCAIMKLKSIHQLPIQIQFGSSLAPT